MFSRDPRPLILVQMTVLLEPDPSPPGEVYGTLGGCVSLGYVVAKSGFVEDKVSSIPVTIGATWVWL